MVLAHSMCAVAFTQVAAFDGRVRGFDDRQFDYDARKHADAKEGVDRFTDDRIDNGDLDCGSPYVAL